MMALIISGGGSSGGGGGDILALQNAIALLQIQLASQVAVANGLQAQVTSVQTAVTAATTTEATVNKDMPALATSSDGMLATASPIAYTPSQDGYVSVFVNGIQVKLGNGTLSADCWFSAGDGSVARLYADIAQGDRLYWAGSVAGFELSPDDLITFQYERQV